MSDDIKSQDARMVMAITAAVVAICALTQILAAANQTIEGPIKARVIDRRRGEMKKGHVATFDLTIVNEHEVPTWFLISSGNTILRESGLFQWAGDNRNIGAFRYDQGKGAVVKLSSSGTRQDNFDAMLLPAHGRVHFEHYQVEDHDPPRFVDIWEAKSLKVNDVTPWERWLPFDVLASREVDITSTFDPLRAHHKNLAWEHRTKANAKPFPEESIRTIRAEVIARHIVPLK